MKNQASKSILQIKNPSSKQFLDMWKQYQPFLIEDVAKHWGACNKWNNDYLIKHCADSTVTVYFFKQDFLDDYKNFAYEGDFYFGKDMRYKEYIEKISNIDDSMGCYLNTEFDECFAGIFEDVTYPEYFKGKPTVTLWHGFSNKNFSSTTTLHFDRIHNIFVQIRGRKRVLLFPPSDYLSFYPPLEDGNGKGIGHNSKVNPDKLNLELFPKFPWQDKMEVILQPGEILYIPPFWWHHVTAIDENMSLSFWYDVKIKDFFIQKNMLSVFLNIAPHYLRYAISSGEALMHTREFFKGIIS